MAYDRIVMVGDLCVTFFGNNPVVAEVAGIHYSDERGPLLDLPRAVEEATVQSALALWEEEEEYARISAREPLWP